MDLFEIMFSNELCNFISLYRPPSRFSDEFENFAYNLGLTLEALIQYNPFITVIIKDFNANLIKGVLPIKHKTTPEGAKVDNLTSQYGLTQHLKEPTHISENYRSCIDLIFTSKPNLVVDFGIYPSLHENCHHQIVYSKFDLKIFYPPPYERTVWHYQQADTELIKRSLESFDWKNAFSSCNPNEQVSMLIKTVLNIMSNFTPNETIMVDDRDPPWIIRRLKIMIQEKNVFYKKYLKPNNQETFQLFSQIQEPVSQATEDSKKKYYEKLSNNFRMISLMVNVIGQF